MADPTLDTRMAASSLENQELVRRKREMDALRARLGDSSSREQRLRESCEGFESLFIQKLWQQMRATVPKEGYLHSRDEEMYQSMFDQELAKKMASAGGIGLADMLFDQLKGQLLNASRTTTPGTMEEAAPVRPLSMKDGIPPPDAQLVPDVPASPPVEAPLEAEDPLYSVFEAEHNTGAMPYPGGASPVAPTVFKEDEEAAGQGVEASSRLSGQAAAPARGLEATDNQGVPGVLHWPAPGEVTSGFGWRTEPITGQRNWHAGLDIAGSTGDPVTACWEGRVVFAGEKGDSGKLVVLEHAGGWRSYYGHNSELSVAVGDRVTAGKEIAKMGSTGRVTEPQLHFELRQGELAWDPEQLRERVTAGFASGSRG